MYLYESLHSPDSRTFRSGPCFRRYEAADLTLSIISAKWLALVFNASLRFFVVQKRSGESNSSPQGWWDTDYPNLFHSVNVTILVFDGELKIADEGVFKRLFSLILSSYPNTNLRYTASNLVSWRENSSCLEYLSLKIFLTWKQKCLDFLASRISEELYSTKSVAMDEKDFEDLFSWIKDISEDIDGLEEVCYHQNREHLLLRYVAIKLQSKTSILSKVERSRSILLFSVWAKKTKRLDERGIPRWTED